MEVFLAGVLTGSNATRQRHLRQARVIQAAIAERWQRETPWALEAEAFGVWFPKHRLEQHSEISRYYYLLTVRLIVRRLEASWKFVLWMQPPSRSATINLVSTGFFQRTTIVI